MNVRSCIATALFSTALCAGGTESLVVRDGDHADIRGRVVAQKRAAIVGGKAVTISDLHLLPSTIVRTAPGTLEPQNFPITEESARRASSIDAAGAGEVVATCRFVRDPGRSSANSLACDLLDIKKVAKKSGDDRTAKAPDLGRVAFQPIHRERLLEFQLGACQKLSAAGYSGAANRCSKRTKNAFEVLLAHSENSELPLSVWGYCSQFWIDDMTLGARCITAAEEICKTTSPGVLQDQTGCLQVMSSGAWVANPKARSLTFDAPGK